MKQKGKLWGKHCVNCKSNLLPIRKRLPSPFAPETCPTPSPDVLLWAASSMVRGRQGGRQAAAREGRGERRLRRHPMSGRRTCSSSRGRRSRACPQDGALSALVRHPCVPWAPPKCRQHADRPSIVRYPCATHAPLKTRSVACRPPWLCAAHVPPVRAPARQTPGRQRQQQRAIAAFHPPPAARRHTPPHPPPPNRNTILPRECQSRWGMLLFASASPGTKTHNGPPSEGYWTSQPRSEDAWPLVAMVETSPGNGGGSQRKDCL